MSIYDLLNPSFQVANEWAKFNTRELIIAIKKIINSRDKRITEALRELKSNLSSQKGFIGRFTEIEKFDQSLFKISEQFMKEIKELIQLDIFEKWREKILGSLKIENKELSESITTALKTKISHGKPRPQWIKSYYQFNYKLREYVSRLKNPDKTFYKYGRRFNLANFIDHFITVPMGIFVYEEWIRALGLVLGNNSEENAAFINFKDTILKTHLLNSGNSYWEELFDFDPKKGITSFLRSQKDLDENLKSFEAGMADRLNEFYYKLIQDVSEKARVAGTYMIPNSIFSSGKTLRKWNDLKNDQLDAKINWTNTFAEQVDDWQKNIELNRLQLKATLSVKATRSVMKNKMDRFLDPKFKQARKDVLMGKQTIEKNTDKSFSKGLLKINDELSDQFQKRYTRPILEFFDQYDLPGIYLDSLAQYRSNFMELTDIRSITSVKEGKKITKQEILFQKTLLDNVYSPLFDLVRNDCDVFKKAQESCSRDLLTLSEVIEFNLNAAEKLANKKRHQESRDTALKGLERALTRIDDVIVRLKAIITETNNKYAYSLLSTVGTLDKFYDGKELIDFVQGHIKKEKRHILDEKMQGLFSLIKKVWPNPKIYIVNSFQNYQQRRMKKGIPINSDYRTGIKDDRISRELLTTYGKIETLPYIYQQLFSWKPLVDERLFIGREDDFAQLIEGQQIFEEGHSQSVAVIGEKGSGKTSLMNIFSVKSSAEVNWQFISFDRTNTEEKAIATQIGETIFNNKVPAFNDLEKLINQSEEQFAIVLDDIHNLFLREIDGFEALEKLLLLISNTDKKVFWFATCDYYAWRFLNKVIHIEKFFSRRIDLKPFSADLLKKVIIRRHQITGFGLYFDPGEKYGNLRMYEHMKTERDKQDFLEENFFLDIEKAANGNIRIALLFWLNATIGFKENDLRIGFRFGPDRSFLYQLGEDENFTLTAFVIHDYMTSEQYAIVFHISNDESHQKLEKLRRLGILANRDGNYSIHPFLYSNIIKTLKINKMIY